MSLILKSRKCNVTKSREENFKFLKSVQNILLYDDFRASPYQFWVWCTAVAVLTHFGDGRLIKMTTACRLGRNQRSVFGYRYVNWMVRREYSMVQIVTETLQDESVIGTDFVRLFKLREPDQFQLWMGDLGAERAANRRTLVAFARRRMRRSFDHSLTVVLVANTWIWVEVELHIFWL